MYLLDTNIIIGILRKNPNILSRYNGLIQTEEVIYITNYSISEIYLGFHIKKSSLKYKTKLKSQEKIFNNMITKLETQERIISLETQSARVLGSILYYLRRAGKPIPIIDAIIAAIGISRKLKIITTDINHFQIIQRLNNELNVEFWEL